MRRPKQATHVFADRRCPMQERCASLGKYHIEFNVGNVYQRQPLQCSSSVQHFVLQLRSLHDTTCFPGSMSTLACATTGSMSATHVHIASFALCGLRCSSHWASVTLAQGVSIEGPNSRWGPGIGPRPSMKQAQLRSAQLLRCCLCQTFMRRSAGVSSWLLAGPQHCSAAAVQTRGPLSGLLNCTRSKCASSHATMLPLVESATMMSNACSSLCRQVPCLSRLCLVGPVRQPPSTWPRSPLLDDSRDV